MLSHVPVERIGGDSVKEKIKETKSEIKEEFIVRAESQEEVNELIEKCFNRKLTLSCDDFAYIIDHIDSGMFLCLLSLLRTHFPSLREFARYGLVQKEGKNELVSSPLKHRLATSKMLSKFVPVSELSKSSIVRSVSVGDFSASVSAKDEKTGSKHTLSKFAETGPKLDNISVPAVRLPNAKQNSTEVTLSPSHFLDKKLSEDQLLFCQCGRQIGDFDILQCDICLQQEQLLKCEGFLFTRPKKGTRLKKFWYVLDRRVFYSYASKGDKTYKKMRSLSGYFIKEEPTERFEDRTLAYCFTLVDGKNRKRKYMCTGKEEYERWCEVIKQSIGYSNLSNYYEFKVSTRVTARKSSAKESTE